MDLSIELGFDSRCLTLRVKTDIKDGNFPLTFITTRGPPSV